jgi:hypothetical protein
MAFNSHSTPGLDVAQQEVFDPLPFCVKWAWTFLGQRRWCEGFVCLLRAKV